MNVKKIISYICIFILAFLLVSITEESLYHFFNNLVIFINGGDTYYCGISLSSFDYNVFQNRLIIMLLGYLVYTKIKSSS